MVSVNTPCQIRKPVPAWKPALLMFTGFVSCAIAVTCYVTSLRDRKWATMQARVNELHADIEAPSAPRLSFDRPVLPGNAWDDYRAAIPKGGRRTPSIASKIQAFLERQLPTDNPNMSGAPNPHMGGAVNPATRGALWGG
jgi:hypothetical protein